MMRNSFLILSVLVLAGCSSTPDATPPQGATTFHPPAEEAPPPPQQSPRAPPPAPVPEQSQPGLAATDPNDRCGAADLQYLVGKPRTEIPVPLDPSKRRVVCSTCIITQDFRSDRQTITFDTDTGIIRSVKCG